jgi:N-acetyl-anhydromuramyl-L-alanine amidase AmpD
MIKHGQTPVDTIFVHCSATRPDWLAAQPLAQKIAEIRRWHKQRGWSDLGYHWIIDRDGQVAQGRAEHVVGAHAQNHNTGSIGICLIGGFGSNENDPFEKNFTPEQDAALRKLIDQIKSRTPIARIRGHNEVAAKACPGFKVARWLEKKPARPELVESTTMQASAIQVASGAAGGVSAVAALDGQAQIVALVICAIIVAAAAWIMRERIKRWVREVAE